MTRPRPRFAPAVRQAVEGLESRCLLSLGGTAMPAAEVQAFEGHGTAVPAARIPRLFIMPDAGRGPIHQAIASARSSIQIGICNLSDPVIVDALTAAVGRGVDVKVIVDRADYLAKPPEQEQVEVLRAGGVDVHLSNPVFPQSFPKYMIVDGKNVLIMTLCIIPQTFTDTRDYGIVCGDPKVVRQVTEIFRTDWAHSAPPGETPLPYNPTPAVRLPNLIVAPTNAIAQLSRLITSARRTLDVTTEVIDDPFLEGQLVAAARRGVRVRVIAPALSREGNHNVPALESLAGAGVQTHVTKGLFPEPGAMPYMHAKTMVVDGRVAYLGSIDLVTTQTSRDRELGIILSQPLFVRPIAQQFESDWSRTAPPGA